jgi:acyl carrier protein
MSRNSRPCGICECGEIVIRTPFRTAGYLESSGRNGAGFVRNPFDRNPADLLYRTGDRGRFLPDGSLEILGRLDDQVKIRGVRVEPDEVTAVLAQYPDVKACAVVPWKTHSGQIELAAYLSVTRQTHQTTEQLHSYLSRHLTAAMVPSVFIYLDHMPLSANGKIDRRGLPSPMLDQDCRKQPYIAASSPIEEALVEIWSKILGVSRIGVKDNFFELGGHSLLAIQIISRVNRRFQMQVPLRKLFENPTISALALTITRLAVENLDIQERSRLLADLEDFKV